MRILAEDGVDVECGGSGGDVCLLVEEILEESRDEIRHRSWMKFRDTRQPSQPDWEGGGQGCGGGASLGVLSWRSLVNK